MDKGGFGGSGPKILTPVCAALSLPAAPSLPQSAERATAQIQTSFGRNAERPLFVGGSPGVSFRWRHAAHSPPGHPFGAAAEPGATSNATACTEAHRRSTDTQKVFLATRGVGENDLS